MSKASPLLCGLGEPLSPGHPAQPLGSNCSFCKGAVYHAGATLMPHSQAARLAGSLRALSSHLPLLCFPETQAHMEATEAPRSHLAALRLTQELSSGLAELGESCPLRRGPQINSACREVGPVSPPPSPSSHTDATPLSRLPTSQRGPLLGQLGRVGGGTGGSLCLFNEALRCVTPVRASREGVR